jgi:hypothetical protein
VAEGGILKDYIENLKSLVTKMASASSSTALSGVTQEEAFQSMLKLDAFSRENATM